MYIGERDIGETIRILRTERGISREELAERVGISRSHLNKIEADIKRPSIITEYSCAVTPQVRQTGNRLSGLAGTAYASLLT